MGVLRKKLEEEHNAMEAANVQAILGSVAAVPAVISAMQACPRYISSPSLPPALPSAYCVLQEELPNALNCVSWCATGCVHATIRAEAGTALKCLGMLVLHCVSVCFLPAQPLVCCCSLP